MRAITICGCVRASMHPLSKHCARRSTEARTAVSHCGNDGKAAAHVQASLCFVKTEQQATEQHASVCPRRDARARRRVFARRVPGARGASKHVCVNGFVAPFAVLYLAIQAVGSSNGRVDRCIGALRNCGCSRGHARKHLALVLQDGVARDMKAVSEQREGPAQRVSRVGYGTRDCRAAASHAHTWTAPRRPHVTSWSPSSVDAPWCGCRERCRWGDGCIAV